MLTHAKIGRNDPCRCGSGRKYKRCCLQKDEALAVSSRRDEVSASTAAVPRPRAPQIAGQTAGQSAGRIAGSTNERTVGPWGLTPYTVAKIAEDPGSAGSDKRLRKVLEKGLRQNWTIAKVAAMTTEAIEAQLAAYGVVHSRERFLALAEGRAFAWSISQSWTAGDPITCRGKEADFLGLAACEIWKRLLPDRPSVEMIDDWMQEGYTLIDGDRIFEACDIWWKVWRTLRPRFTRAMTTMDQAAAVFSGMQSIFNWSQDFEMHLGDAAWKEPRYAATGRQYCAEWMDQFKDEGDLTQVNFGRALASFLFRLGEADQAADVLHGLIEKWPNNVWGYVALADAHSHFFPGEYDLPLDLQKAVGYLDRGLALEGIHAHDREALEERLSQLRKRRQRSA